MRNGVFDENLPLVSSVWVDETGREMFLSLSLFLSPFFFALFRLGFLYLLFLGPL